MLPVGRLACTPRTGSPWGIMDQSEINRLQSEFNLKFTDDYVRVLRAYPLHEPSEELLDSYDILQEYNSEIRKSGFWGVNVPSSFWLIGLDGMGGGEFINCDAGETYVYIFDHATPPKDMSDEGQLRPLPICGAHPRSDCPRRRVPHRRNATTVAP
jgi:hypothetical protein